jgi:hypothetical protein
LKTDSFDRPYQKKLVYRPMSKLARKGKYAGRHKTKDNYLNYYIEKLNVSLSKGY